MVPFLVGFFWDQSENADHLMFNYSLTRPTLRWFLNYNNINWFCSSKISWTAGEHSMFIKEDLEYYM